jgi:hypothetical protein
MKRYNTPKDSLVRFASVNISNLQAVEKEIDFLISISDNPSQKTIREITSLIGIAKSLGTKRSW